MTHLVRGALGPGQEQAFEVTLHGSSCYTMLAVAESTDQEVDLHLLDGRGGELAQDRTMGHQAAIEHCPPRDGAFRIVVRMYRGSGRFGLQLFGS